MWIDSSGSIISRFILEKEFFRSKSEIGIQKFILNLKLVQWKNVARNLTMDTLLTIFCKCTGHLLINYLTIINNFSVIKLTITQWLCEHISNLLCCTREYFNVITADMFTKLVEFDCNVHNWLYQSDWFSKDDTALFIFK